MRSGLSERRHTDLLSRYFGFLESLFYNGDNLFGMMLGCLSWEEASAWRSDKCLARVREYISLKVHDACIVMDLPTPTLLADPSIPSTYLGLSSSIYLYNTISNFPNIKEINGFLALSPSPHRNLLLLVLK